MNRKTKIVTFTAVLAIGLVSFFATLVWGGVTSQQNREPLDQYLDLSADQSKAIKASQPAFSQDATTLSADLRKEKTKLAAMLDDAHSTDDVVLAQVERVVTAQAALERRVAQHVLAIRKHLTPLQQKRLMGLCASSVRGTGARAKSTAAETRKATPKTLPPR